MPVPSLPDMRLFVAIPLEAGVREALAGVQRHFEEFAPAIKWVRVEHLHLTLKFLGEVPAGDLSRVTDHLQQAILGQTKSGAIVEGVGSFPPNGRPEVIWAGVKDDAGRIAALQSAMEGKLEEAGFERDCRPYSPHVTLGRVKPTRAAVEIRRRLSKTTLPACPMEVSTVVLYSSELKREGPVYRVVREWKLA